MPSVTANTVTTTVAAAAKHPATSPSSSSPRTQLLPRRRRCHRLQSRSCRHRCHRRQPPPPQTAAAPSPSTTEQLAARRHHTAVVVANCCRRPERPPSPTAAGQLPPPSSPHRCRRRQLPPPSRSGREARIWGAPPPPPGTAPSQPRDHRCRLRALGQLRPRRLQPPPPQRRAPPPPRCWGQSSASHAGSGQEGAESGHPAASTRITAAGGLSPRTRSAQESVGASTAASSSSSARLPTSSTVVGAATSPTPCATVDLDIAAAEVAAPELGRSRGLQTPRPWGGRRPRRRRPCGRAVSGGPLGRRRGGRRAVGVVWRRRLGRLPCRPCPGSDAEGKTVYLGLRLIFLGCLCVFLPL